MGPIRYFPDADALVLTLDVTGDAAATTTSAHRNPPPEDASIGTITKKLTKLFCSNHLETHGQKAREKVRCLSSPQDRATA